MKKICASLISMMLVLGLISGCSNENIEPTRNVEITSSIETISRESTENTGEINETEVRIEESYTEETVQPTEKPTENQSFNAPESTHSAFDVSEVPQYEGTPYAVVNSNVPFFTSEDITTVSFESYSDLDNLGRCGVAYASIGKDLMPTEERGGIGQVKPAGWHTVKYDCVDGKYLYNRCHLIGYQLTAENANEKNMLTGTRYLNIQGMLPFENMVADYIKETENHVLYRVTPVYDGSNLIADGLLMEAWSVEDSGDGVCICVFVYNVQPGIVIDYATGDSYEMGADGENPTTEETSTDSQETGAEYVLNTNSKKFHYPWCSSVDQMKESNKESYNGSRDDLIDQGYEPCKRCNP